MEHLEGGELFRLLVKMNTVPVVRFASALLVS
jgi:hypothetical protein